MKYAQRYGGLIWTNHAILRLKERGFSQDQALLAFKNPDQSFKGKKGGVEYRKRIENSLLTLIAKQNERREWVVISAWVDPPLPGSPDWKKREEYRKYQKASFWGKFWLTFKGQIGF